MPGADTEIPLLHFVFATCAAAYGPGATVECRWRAVHSKSSKLAKLEVQEENLPAAKPKICVQSSVTFTKDDGIQYAQHLHYGSKEWDDTCRCDRNTNEGFDGYIKDGPEKFKDTAARRVRGLTAHQFVGTMLLVAANFRNIASFLHDLARATPKVKYPRGP